MIIHFSSVVCIQPVSKLTVLLCITEGRSQVSRKYYCFNKLLSRISENMSNRRNGHKSALTNPKAIDFNDLIEHYQTLNNEIQLKTVAAFEAVDKLANSCNHSKEKNGSVEKITNVSHGTKSSETPLISMPDLPSQTGSEASNKTITELNVQLKTLQQELEAACIKTKRLEIEKEEYHQQLVCMKDNDKKIKILLNSKQALIDSHKTELRAVTEKLRVEEIFRRNLQKDIEKLNKDIMIITNDKEKLNTKFQRCKADYLLYKQKKESEQMSGNQKIPVMLRCIRKQAMLIENLSAQIAHLYNISDIQYPT